MLIRNKSAIQQTVIVLLKPGIYHVLVCLYSLNLANIYLHEQDYFFGRILPAGKPASFYSYEADAGYPYRDIDHPGEMGTDDGAAFIRQEGR